MPYIKKERRPVLWRDTGPYTTYPVVEAGIIAGPGELNFAITKIVNLYVRRGGLNYTVLNEALGVLTAVTFELYRRLAAPYEDVKIMENGDVF